MYPWAVIGHFTGRHGAAIDKRQQFDPVFHRMRILNSFQFFKPGFKHGAIKPLEMDNAMDIFR